MALYCIYQSIIPKVKEKWVIGLLFENTKIIFMDILHTTVSSVFRF